MDKKHTPRAVKIALVYSQGNARLKKSCKLSETNCLDNYIFVRLTIYYGGNLLPRLHIAIKT